MSDLIGRTLGQYEIVAEIGHGGMADVFRAVQHSTGREVAIKVLPAYFQQDRTFLERFNREVKIITRLQHPRILPVYDYGEHEGQPYIVMAYIPGGTLAQWIREAGSSGLLLDEVARLVGQIAEGLDFAHHNGIIHRDFKPSNVLLDQQGNPYLADFGIARVAEETGHLTGSGMVGTPQYMAPEMGKPGGLSPLVDVYALGVTLFEMLTGAHPYHADTPIGVLMAHLSEPIPDVRQLRPDLPDAVQTVIERAMTKNPAERYQSAGELAADLRSAVATGAVAPREVVITPAGLVPRHVTEAMTRAEPLPPARRRISPLAWIAAAAAGAIGVAGIAGVVVLINALNASAQPTAAVGSPTAGAGTPPATQPTGVAVAGPTATWTPGGPAAQEVARIGRGRIQDIDISGDYLAVAAGSGVYVYDANTFAEVWHRETPRYVDAVACNDEYSSLFSASDDTVIEWDLATGQQMRADTPIHDVNVIRVAASPDGSTLAFAMADRSIILWSVTGWQLFTLSGHTGDLTGLVFSPDGTLLASASEDKTISLWDVATGQQIRSLTGFEYVVPSLAFSPGGDMLASAIPGSVALWDVATGQPGQTLSPDGYLGSDSLAFSPNGAVLAVGGYGGIALFDVASGRQTSMIADSLETSAAELLYSPDGGALISLMRDETIIRWDAATGQQLQSLKDFTSSIASLALSPDGNTIATSSYMGTLMLWDVAARQPRQALTAPDVSSHGLSFVAFSPAGNILATGGASEILLWDVATSQLSTRLAASSTLSVIAAAFSPDGQTLAASYDDGSIILWDVATRQQRQTLTGSAERSSRLAFSPDGSMLAAAAASAEVTLWDMTTGQPARTLVSQTGWALSLAFSPDGATLAVGLDNGGITLWDVPTGQPLRDFSGTSTSEIDNLAFSPDGQMLASASGSVSLWDVATGQRLQYLIGHGYAVKCVAFLPTGHTLITGSQDGTISLWEYTP